MESLTAPAIELIALRPLHNAVRCVRDDGSKVSFRRDPQAIVAGQRLVVVVRTTWTWRRTSMISGQLRSRDFSLRALAHAGFELPRAVSGVLDSPGERDERLGEGLAELASGAWVVAQALLLDVLERTPACLVAHARLGIIAASLEHRDLALAHLTATVRLALGAMAAGPRQLDPTRRAERAVLEALRCRAEILMARNEPEQAAADLRRGLAWDPDDTCRMRGLLDAATAREPLACS